LCVQIVDTVKDEILKTTIYQPHRCHQKSNDADTFSNLNFDLIGMAHSKYYQKFRVVNVNV